MAVILKIAYFLVKPVLLALSSTAVCNGRKDDHCQKASTHELFSLIPRQGGGKGFGMRPREYGVWSGQNEALHSLRFSAARTRLLSTSDVSPFTSGWLVVCCAARGLTAVG